MICIQLMLMFLAAIIKLSPPPLGLGKCRELMDPASRPPDYFTVLLSCYCIGSHHLSPTVRSRRPILSSLSHFFALRFFCLCVWAGLGKSCSLVSVLFPNKMYVALNHEEQHHTTSFLQSSFLFPLPTSICPDKSVADAPTPSPLFNG